MEEEWSDDVEDTNEVAKKKKKKISSLGEPSKTSECR